MVCFYLINITPLPATPTTFPSLFVRFNDPSRAYMVPTGIGVNENFGPS